MKKSPVTGEDVPDESARAPVMHYVNPRKAVWPDADFARDANLDEADRGLRVMDVSPSGPARGLLAPRGTDVLTDVLYPVKKKLRAAVDLQGVLATLKPGDVVSLRVYSTAEPLIGPRVVNLRVAE